MPFADDVDLFPLSDPDLHCALGQFAAVIKTDGMKVNMFESDAIVMFQKAAVC